MRAGVPAARWGLARVSMSPHQLVEGPQVACEEQGIPEPAWGTLLAPPPGSALWSQLGASLWYVLEDCDI